MLEALVGLGAFLVLAFLRLPMAFAMGVVGFCGVCDVITQASGDVTKFHNGIATNVRDGCTPAPGQSARARRAWRSSLPQPRNRRHTTSRGRRVARGGDQSDQASGEGGRAGA